MALSPMDSVSIWWLCDWVGIGVNSFVNIHRTDRHWSEEEAEGTQKGPLHWWHLDWNWWKPHLFWQDIAFCITLFKDVAHCSLEDCTYASSSFVFSFWEISMEDVEKACCNKSWFPLLLVGFEDLGVWQFFSGMIHWCHYSAYENYGSVAYIKDFDSTSSEKLISFLVRWDWLMSNLDGNDCNNQIYMHLLVCTEVIFLLKTCTYNTAWGMRTRISTTGSVLA